MKLRVLVCALAAVGVTATATVWAKKPLNPDYVAARKEIATQRAVEALAATATVGDADSFGRNVRFIGLMNSGVVSLASDCTPDPDFPPGPDDHCIVTNPAPTTTTFNIPDVARVLIPAKSANSLFCHWQTPLVVYGFRNPTASYQPNGRIVITPTYTIQNPVLNDPSLINPDTGLPFGGSFTVSLTGIRHQRGLQPGDYQVERDSSTRSCIGGIVSKAALIEGWGLSPTQAANFFKNDTVITMNITGSATLVDFASIVYGVRFVGD